jgi:DNA-binding transcriptional ArsR family regulator
MHVIKSTDKEILGLSTKEINIDGLKRIGSDLAIRILKTIKNKEMYPKQIAETIGEHEQKIYYHIKNLEAAGLIKIKRTESIKGSLAKYYKTADESFFFKLKEFSQVPNVFKHKGDIEFLKPFVEDGKLNALIITGSPDPHGPDKARSRDGYYGIDLGLFLGTFLSSVPELNVKLDTEIRDSDLNNNLILIGGPVVNKITEKVNDSLPINFKKDNNWIIYSSLTKNSYPQDEVGIIVKAPNPLNPSKYILLVAGKRYAGTKAALIGIIKHFKDVCKGNMSNPNFMAKVVEGIDMDSDGMVDSVEFRE